MKIEMGESLLQSFLKYVKNCLVSQTNWKASASWDIPQNNLSSVSQLFTQIQKHKDFSSVFKGTSLEQALKQAELDVIGINNDKLYMVEVAFHENGLQYGDKEQTKDRVCKKLLRAYLIGRAYFPNFSYEILFTSPKVNPATNKIIQSYFATLVSDFGIQGKVKFCYIANDDFKNEILFPTLKASQNDSDTSDLFIRSTKLLEIFSVLGINHTKPQQINKDKQPINLNKSKDSLKLTLKSVGMAVFIKYYDYFISEKYAVKDLKSLLLKAEKFEKNTCATKASSGKSIVKKGLIKEALNLISTSSDADLETVKKAKDLLKKM